MGTRERRERSDDADHYLRELFSIIEQEFPQISKAIGLAAVGGYGRGELVPGSDLDLLIIHDGSIRAETLSEIVNSLLYPLWNSSRSVDHSVRTRAETRATATADIKVAMGLLDLRFVVGNQDLISVVAQDATESWRKNFKANFPQIVASVTQRASGSRR